MSNNLISVLCIDPRGHYPKLQEKYNLDLWDINRDAYNYKGNNPVITHAPCQQWSRLHHFANDDPKSKDLAFYLWDIVNKNGGIFEHPLHSNFFKKVNPTLKNIYCVYQGDFGFVLKKPTALYFSKIKPLPYPLNFEAKNFKKHTEVSQKTRSIMTESFAVWLIKNVQQLFTENIC